MPSTGDAKHDAENRGPITIIVSSVLTTVGLLFLAARIASRRISARKLAVDDYLVVFSVILNIIYLALSGVAVGHGAGRHVDVLYPSSTSKAIYFTIVAFAPGVLSFTVPKFAVLILLVKILHPGVIHRRIMWVVSVIYALAIIAMIAINFAQCSPPATQWGGAQGKCWPRSNTFAYSLMIGIFSAMFDFYLAIYPTVVLSRLNMGWKKKVGLSCALGFGYCAGAITVYKCTTLTGLAQGDDFTWHFQGIVLWTSIEANCVLIGACIPTLYPLIRKVFGARALGTGGSSERTKQGRRTIDTFGSSGKDKRKPDDISALDTRDTGNGHAGGIGSGHGDGETGPEMAERQASGQSGATMLRDAEEDVPVSQP